MKRRGFFSLVLMILALMPTSASTSFIDLGFAQELVVLEQALADAETDSASTVTIITQEQIKAFNVQSTADLV